MNTPAGAYFRASIVANGKLLVKDCADGIKAGLWIGIQQQAHDLPITAGLITPVWR